MKIIDRYLLRQLLIPFVYCLAALSMLILVWDLFDHFTEFVAAETRVPVIFRYYAALVAASMEYVLPSSLLLATLYAFWQMTRANEIVAMRSAGLGFNRIMLPFLGVGAAASLAAAWVKEVYVPRAAEWANAFEQADWQEPSAEIHEDYPYYSDLTRRQWNIDLINLSTPAILYGVTLKQERPDHSTEFVLKARRALWLDGVWWFMDLEAPERYDAAGNPLPSSHWPKASGEMLHAMPEFHETPMDFIQDLKSDEFMSISELHYRLSTCPPGSNAQSELTTTLSRRLAMPWACLIVTFFAIPAGNKGSRQSPVNGILTAMGCFIAYYILLQTGTILARLDLLPPLLGPWLANFVFALAGGFMLIRLR